jgi:4'-phosphopantetheinyl transferase EntD
MNPWPDRALIVRATYDVGFFSGSELAAAGELKLAKRREEWLLSRFAAKRLALQLGVVTDPRLCSIERPFLSVEGQATPWFASLSHSAPYAAAAIGPEPIGIDVQVVREMPEAASHLFLSDEEADAMRECTIANRLLHFWCAKEAEWKRRLGDTTTLRQVPLRLVAEREGGLRFEGVETVASGDLIAAITD